MRTTVVALIAGTALLLGGCGGNGSDTTATVEQGTTALSAIKLPAGWTPGVQSNGMQGGHPTWDWSYTTTEPKAQAVTDYERALKDAGWTTISGGGFTKDSFLLVPSANDAACADGSNTCSSVTLHMVTK